MILRFLGCMGLLLIAGCAPQHTMVVQRNSLALGLWAPKAGEVGFASSLDQFAVHQVAKDRQGQWVVAGLPNREFQYFYLVDGKVFLPECRLTVRDDFGALNCRYIP